MRVGVVARLLTEPSLRGWNRYTVNLLAALARLDGLELVLYSTGPVHEAHRARLTGGDVTERVAPPMRLPKWEQVWLPARCRADKVDVLHSPFNFGLPWSSPCPRVLTLHDAIEWVYYEPRTPLAGRVAPVRLKSRFYHRLARARAHRVITVSRHAEGDIVGRLGVPAERVRVVYEAADPHFLEPVTDGAKARARARFGLERPYFFSTAKQPARNEADSRISCALTLSSTRTLSPRQGRPHHASCLAQGYGLRALGTGSAGSGLPCLRAVDAHLRPPLPPLLHAGRAGRTGLQAQPLP